MTFWWFIILLNCGFWRGWNTIDLLYWLLLIPFALEDHYDAELKKWLNFMIGGEG